MLTIVNHVLVMKHNELKFYSVTFHFLLGTKTKFNSSLPIVDAVVVALVVVVLEENNAI